MVLKTRFFGVFCLLALASFGGVFIPQTSEEYMRYRPMADGAAAFVPNGGEATMYLGTGSTMPRRVTDPAALRGSRTLTIGPGDFAISADSNWVHNVEQNTYRTTKNGAVIVVTVPPQYDVSSIACDFYGEGGEMSPDQPNMFHHYDGNTCAFECSKGACTAVTVRGFTVKVKAFGDGAGETDLTATTYRLKDVIGWFDFANLRDQCFHYNDGNLGQDWSKYAASNTVHLAGHRVVYDEKGRYSARISNTNLVFDAGGYEAIKLSFRGASAAEGSLRITEFGITNGVAYMTYTADIDGFNPSRLGVRYTDELGEGWINLTEGEFTVNGDRVTIPNAQIGSQGFWRLYYGGVISQVLTVTLRGNVVVRDALYLYGSGSDTNQLYQIKVTNGTLSAVPANLE